MVVEKTGDAGKLKVWAGAKRFDRKRRNSRRELGPFFPPSIGRPF